MESGPGPQGAGVLTTSEPPLAGTIIPTAPSCWACRAHLILSVTAFQQSATLPDTLAPSNGHHHLLETTLRPTMHVMDL